MTFAEALQYYGGKWSVTLLILRGKEAFAWKIVVDGRAAIFVWYRVQVRID